MSNSKTAILLFSGAWHTHFHLAPAIKPLENFGYRVVGQPLATANGAGTTFADNVSTFETAIRTELAAGQNVVICAHSLAGPPSCEAISNVLASPSSDQDGKILRFILVASFVILEDNNKIAAHLAERQYFRWGEGPQEGLLITGPSAREAFFNDMSDADAKPFVDALTPLVPVQAPEKPRDGWEAVEGWYMRCALDQSVLPAVQDAIIQRHGLKVVKMEAGHDPFVSRPGEFAGAIDGVIRG